MNKKIDKTDLTFFTNDKDNTLLDRFRTVLNDTQFFDVLVGYFRSSGFYQLYESFEDIDKIRILVGLSVDKDSYDILQYHKQMGLLDFESHQRTKKKFQKNLINEIEASDEDDSRLEIGIKKFIEFLQLDYANKDEDILNGGNGKKLEIRAYPSKNIHAKVYIGRYHPEDRDYGFVITGSSNFSESGLMANREFNVQLKDKRDVHFAEDQFNSLWEDSVDLSEDFVDTITQKTWLNDQITPYELYLKLIYEYLEEDINLEDQFDPFLPEGFMNLKYQSQAAIQAKKILDTYDGVFLADVVGLGKTFITALLLQQIRGKTLVICPPVLKDYWKDSLFDFGIRSFKVESLGKLEHIIKKGIEKYDYIVVDEAHRFRNEGTASYANLLDICRGKKVILVTATPLNNTVDDIFAQLKLFQAPKNSTIPGVPNLEKFFNNLKRKLNKFSKDDPQYKVAIREISNEIKNNILRYVMVRRTRSDIIKYFKDDMVQQKLFFPEMADPKKIVYIYEGELEKVFTETIKKLHDFKYARYTPLLDYAGNKVLSEFERQQQKNIGGFMKGILVKRLESSFFAFRQSIKRFIISYENFIEMFDAGTLYISKKINVYDLIDNDDFDKLEELVAEERVNKYDAKDFKKGYREKLEFDLKILQDIQKIWDKDLGDPKLEQFILDLKKDTILKKNKLVIFTESKETGDYLYEALADEFGDKVIFYSSKGGRQKDKITLSNHTISRDLIKANFDPNEKEQLDDLRILVTTDILAEGINLHRSNIVINYDLPWNPTRILQRVGRVNRLGSKFDEIFIYNFFPTTHSDKHLGLETNITNKIQMFHDILGEDAKYLTDGEDIGSQELFNTLNNKKSYTGEDQEGDSELRYLEMIRKLRDENPDLFKKIKELPKKSRSGFKSQDIDSNQLVTFFRIAKLKKFYKNIDNQSEEITFFDAVQVLECSPLVKREQLPQNYYESLNVNKSKFELDTKTNEDSPLSTPGRSNVKYIEDRLKTPLFKNCKKFTDSDDEFITSVKNMLSLGTMAKKTAQLIKKELEKTLDPIEALNILRKHIRAIAIESSNDNKKKLQKREVILSGYLVKG